MRNRAKCKLCLSILESFHRNDYVTCKCGEISIDGGLDELRTGARNWCNFIRVDDEGNEILVKVKDSVEPIQSEEPPRISKPELLDMLDIMAKNIENLPPQALSLPINHYDFLSFMLLVSSILRS